MKRMLFFLMMVSVLCSLLAGCGGRRGIKVPPEWYLNSEDFLKETYGSEESYFFGTGQATRPVSSLAKQRADSRAMSEVKRQIVLQMKARVQEYLGSGAIDARAVLDVDMRNPWLWQGIESPVIDPEIGPDMLRIRVIQRFTKDNRTFFSLAVCSLTDAQRWATPVLNRVMRLYRAAEEALFEEPKDRHAFDALDRDEISKKLVPQGGNNPERD